IQLMAPTLHTQTPEANARYRVEPYVVVADIYDLPSQRGRGGWSWYTGSSAWMYRIWLEKNLGFKKTRETLHIQCAIPKAWDQFKIHYRYGSSHYEITVQNPNHLSSFTSQEIPLKDDGGHHPIEIVIQ